MNLLQRISIKIGLTETELKVISFLTVILLIGLLLKFFGWKNTSSSISNFDYSASDSIFYASNYSILEKNKNNEFDSNQESSDFNKSNFISKVKKQELKEKSINLNSASIEELSLLPGIGIKTAEKIIAYRKANDGFSNIDELLEVRGIGNSKFEIIKKYIFVR